MVDLAVGCNVVDLAVCCNVVDLVVGCNAMRTLTSNSRMAVTGPSCSFTIGPYFRYILV